MVLEQINWAYINDHLDKKNPLVTVLTNLFVNATTLHVVVNEGQRVFGGLYQLEDNRLVFVSNTFKSYSTAEFQEANVSDRTHYLEHLVSVCRVYPTLGDAFWALRTYKQDNASYFEHRWVIDPIIKHLYQERLIRPDEILR